MPTIPSVQPGPIVNRRTIRRNQKATASEQATDSVNDAPQRRERRFRHERRLKKIKVRFDQRKAINRRRQPQAAASDEQGNSIGQHINTKA